MEKIVPATTSVPATIGNAGLVILSLFLPRMFHLLGLTESGRFKNETAQIRGMLALQYAALGEAELLTTAISLNRVLTGAEPSTALSAPGVFLTDDEKAVVDTMLSTAVQHWEKLKNTTVSAFRVTFLEREGRLSETDEAFFLSVVPRSYDQLLDSLPWSYSPIVFSWMSKPLNVEWR